MKTNSKERQGDGSNHGIRIKKLHLHVIEVALCGAPHTKAEEDQDDILILERETRGIEIGTHRVYFHSVLPHLKTVI